VVSHALGVENAVVDAYERILRAGVLDRRATGAARLLADQEREHVAALARALRRLGGAPSDQRDPGVLHGLPVRPRTSAQAWRLAAGVERAALSTYYRAVAQLADDALLQLATEIMANEGQHLALARGRLGHELAPDAFPTGAPPSS
jgi:rubrerythrin